MSNKAITRAQFEAIRTAELAQDNGAPSGDVLAGRYLISATTPTAAVLVRLGLAENITLTSAGTEFVFPVLTEVGEAARKRIERDGFPLRLSAVEDIRRAVEAKNAPKPYTVVLDWAGDRDGEAPVVHVYADTAYGAFRAALEGAWHMYAGQIEEIPEGAEYDEGAAEDLWYGVATFQGHAVATRD
ncbi:hypothetical protein ACFRNJ_12320 [Streptomyces sp. NPDC056721]|uniref:hypothetical protein n=1 Tax=Streptomyces sp. NPDC056721 TaxID=3345923 RepID=UPI00368C1BB1